MSCKPCLHISRYVGFPVGAVPIFRGAWVCLIGQAHPKGRKRANVTGSRTFSQVGGEGGWVTMKRVWTLSLQWGPCPYASCTDPYASCFTHRYRMIRWFGVIGLTENLVQHWDTRFCTLDIWGFLIAYKRELTPKLITDHHNYPVMR